jgi:hypothetical protein
LPVLGGDDLYAFHPLFAVDLSAAPGVGLNPNQTRYRIMFTAAVSFGRYACNWQSAWK